MAEQALSRSTGHNVSFPMKAAALSKLKAFSLIEVVLAVAIIAFAIIPVITLMPVGLNSMQGAVRQSRASEILATANSHVRSQYSLSKIGTVALTDALADDLSKNKMAWSQSYGVREDGSIVPSGSSTPYKLYVQLVPQSSTNPLCRGYLTVAWPETATYGAAGWTNHQGSVETYIYASPLPLDYYP